MTSAYKAVDRCPNCWAGVKPLATAASDKMVNAAVFIALLCGRFWFWDRCSSGKMDG